MLSCSSTTWSRKTSLPLCATLIAGSGRPRAVFGPPLSFELRLLWAWPRRLDRSHLLHHSAASAHAHRDLPLVGLRRSLVNVKDPISEASGYLA